jgi:hypothetical protein
MDPFLHLLHETKLQVNYYHEDPLKTYGSPEDNQNAMKSLSAVELSESQSQESMVFLGHEFHIRFTRCNFSSILRKASLILFELNSVIPY